ncbi:MAG TPA: GDP-mannose 4,6-dehydratase, partial [Gemmatimonadaceae bacterium]
ATKALPEKGRLDARAFNIGSGEGTSVLQIAKLLQATARTVVPLEFAPRRPGEQQESFVDPSKAREILGWAPEVPLAEGLAKSFAWFAGQNGGAAI